jgi:sialic acid synthase SpsE
VENRIVGEEEQVQKIKMRRSALALENLEIGEVLAWNNVEFKRPGDGIAPDLFESLVGRKLKNSVNKGQVIKFEDVLFE